MNALLAVIAPALLTACATIGPPEPPSLQLPKPPADLRASRKGDHVVLSWTEPTLTTDRLTVRGVGATRICRGTAPELQLCGSPVGGVAPEHSGADKTQNTKPQLARTYTDSLPAQLQSDDPLASVTYAVEVPNAAGRSAGLSNQVRISAVRTLPPPQDFAVRVTNQGVVLSWTNQVQAEVSGGALHYVYRVYRKPEGSSQPSLVGEVAAGNERKLSLTDSGMQWEKTYEYHARTVTVVSRDGEPALQIEGDDTSDVKVFAHDIFPPTVPSGLQAVASGPGQKNFVDLVWAPVTDVDLDGYYVYRHQPGAAPARLNAEPVKSPAFRDESVASGKQYIYSVSAIDVRGNESGKSEEASENVP